MALSLAWLLRCCCPRYGLAASSIHACTWGELAVALEVAGRMCMQGGEGDRTCEGRREVCRDEVPQQQDRAVLTCLSA